jgi:peptide deformylase
LQELIANMWETMVRIKWCRLAAPQIGKSINLFVVDATPMEDPNYVNLKRLYINAEIIEEFGEKWEYEEGCLSIPNIRDKVKTVFRYCDPLLG